MIEMALKLLFLPQNYKNHPVAGVSASLCDMLKLHRFAQRDAKIRQFLQKNFLFSLSPLPFAKSWLRFWSPSLLQTDFSSNYMGPI